MSILFSFLFSLGLLAAKPAPVFASVHIDSRGPYRFLVDTGAQTSLIDPQLAEELHLQPTFRVELVTAHSMQLAPGLKLTTLRLGQQTLPETETIFHTVDEAKRLDTSVRGILGWNALAGFDFLLSPATGQLNLNAARPPGNAVKFYPMEGRIAIKARMGRETLTLILDSGSNHIVLFRLPAAMTGTPPVPTTISTIEGLRSAASTTWTAPMSLANHLRLDTLPAAVVGANGTRADGLLPASVFKTIFVDQSRDELVLVR